MTVSMSPSAPVSAAEPGPATDTGGALPAARAGMLAGVERRLTDLLAAQKQRWCAVDRRAELPIDVVADLVGSGGKRVRPVFCLTGYLAVGGDPAGRVAVDAAAALELLQAFALLHDDVLDDSVLRRGAPTAHVRWAAEHERLGWAGEGRRFGEGLAMLAGDLAYSWSDQLAVGLTEPARVVWNELRTEMIIGQSLDIAVAAEQVADPELARWIALCKSGHYTIHRPLLLGATIAGRPDLTDAFEDYGLAVGEAFQLRDDLIDAFGDGAAGKPAGLDFDQHKMTLLLALVMQRDERVREVVQARSWDPDRLRALIVTAGVRAEVERHIDELVRTAREAISRAPLPAAWRDELAELAGRVAYRDR